MSNGTNDHPLVDFKSSTIHGTGGYARRAISAGEKIIEYVGEQISKEEANRRCEMENPFIFAIDDKHDLDGNVPWNPARWLNHSCSPNCEAVDHNGRIWIVAARDIDAGEELTYNYGYSLEEYDEHPCQCGSHECLGFIVAAEFHDLVRRKLSMRAAVVAMENEG